MGELTVFINVNIPSLNASSKLTLKIESRDEITKNEITNIKTDKKYLFISFCKTFESIKWNLLVNTFFGFEYDKISLNEYLNKKYIFKNLIPELVEKKDPPIITINKNKNHKLDGVASREIPILDMLLVKEKRINEKL